jgi:uncharacterized protein involved in response to NO
MDFVFRFPAPIPQVRPYAPVWALGFRPFFLGAAAWAVLLIGLWVLTLTGVMPLAYPNPVAWHAHEMVYGYTIAVIAGFLLTAAKNWTGVPTPYGKSLAAIFLLWLAGRIAMALPVPPAFVFFVDALFLPVLCFAVAKPIVKAKNWRNLGFVPMLLVLAGLNIAFHALPQYASQLMYAAVGIIIVMITLIGGRIVPGFTQNALPDAKIVRLRWADWAALVCTIALVPLDLFAAHQWAAAVAFTAGVFQLLRMAGWKSFATRSKPILWILHVGYFCVPLGLLLRSIPSIVPAPVALHALTIGAIGLLTLGMMTRVSLGHTGRKLEVAPSIVAAYVLLCAAVAVRILGPLLVPEQITLSHSLAGVAWVASFVIFGVVYTPMLLTPRPDGKPG